MIAHSSSVSGPGLSRMLIGDAHLADIVQQRAPANNSLPGQPHGAGQAQGEFQRSQAMVFG